MSDPGTQKGSEEPQELSRWTDRIYGRLLLAYPATFRYRFADGMRFAFVRQAQEARLKGAGHLAWFWIRSVAHVLFLGLGERFARRRRKGERMRGTVQDALHAARRLRRTPGFTIAAVLTLALGIGASTTIYSLVHSVVLEPLRYPDADRLVWVGHSAHGAEIDLMGTSWGAYLQYSELNQAFEEIAAYGRGAVTLSEDGDPTRVRAAVVTHSFFDVFLGGALPIGRPISEEDDQPGAPIVAVVSHSLWQQRYGAGPDVVGRTVQVEGVTAEIVGVMPAGFDVPTADTDMWFARQLDPPNTGFGNFGTRSVGRLKPGVSIEAAHADLARVISMLEERLPAAAWEMFIVDGLLAPVLMPLKERVVGDTDQMLWILLGTVGFVLLVACANVANLLLVRGETRRREIAVRSALGASKGRIARYHLTESMVLAVLGGALGLLLAFGGIRALLRYGPDSLPRIHEVGIGPAVIGFAAALTLLVGFTFGMIPVVRRQASNLVDCIKDGGTTATAGRERHGARNLLVVAQVSLALVLLIGAGLMVRSFWYLSRVEPGFDYDSSLIFRVSLPQALYPSWAEAMTFQQELLDRLAVLPGVRSVGATTCLNFDGCNARSSLYVEGVEMGPGDLPQAVDLRGASGGYFIAMGIPLVEGRLIDATDHLRDTGVAVLSQNVAERLFPGESAIGKRVYPDWPDTRPPYTVVGVVGDTRSYTLSEEPVEIAYFSFLGPYPGMTPTSSLTYVVNSEGDPLAFAGAVRREIAKLDPNVPAANLRTMEDLLARAEAPMAFTMFLLVVAGGGALTLGAIGVYGVLAYVVSQRTGEIGVRMALGAGARDISRMVLRQGIVVVGIGVVLGLAAAYALTRLMTALLYGITATDPLTYGGVVGGLVLVALLASYLPARRAASVDPAKALRAK